MMEQRHHGTDTTVHTDNYMNTEHKHDGTKTPWNRHNIHTDNYMNTEHKHDGTQTSWNRHNSTYR